MMDPALLQEKQAMGPGQEEGRAAGVGVEVHFLGCNFLLVGSPRAQPAQGASQVGAGAVPGAECGARLCEGWARQGHRLSSSCSIVR